MISSMQAEFQEPIGRIMGHISQKILSLIRLRLEHLDIDHSFYPLLLIEAENGKLTQNDLAKKLHCDKVQVVRIIDYLSSKGFVTRVIHADDRRKYRLEITDKAKQFLPEIKNTILEINSIGMNNISEKQVQQVYAILKIIDVNITSYKNTFYEKK
jgi:MarR family transcriptional regulator, transcriptional regulator for hemolysin